MQTTSMRPTCSNTPHLETKEARMLKEVADTSDSPSMEMPNKLKQDHNARLRDQAKLASEDSMKKWLYLPATILLASFSLLAQAPVRKNIKTEGTKVAAATEI